MSDADLARQLEELVNGTITPDQHSILQSILKRDAAARAQLRERMDLEAALRTWASESKEPSKLSTRAAFGNTSSAPPRVASRWLGFAAVAAACLLIVTASYQLVIDPSPPNPTLSSSVPEVQATVELLGRLQEGEDCRWEVRPVALHGQFAASDLKLASGIAELQFESGTDLTLEGPCEIKIGSANTATLLAGSVFVNVTELSNGFELATPESTIVDEGTKFAVAIDSETTEVHVFDGSVIWIPESTPPGVLESIPNQEERIEAGQARSYLRREPSRGQHIPFGQRQFVRKLEQDVRQYSGSGLVAYDGFENLAGKVRLGRSGFGWEGGWLPAGRTRTTGVQIVDATTEARFGHDRTGRRMMILGEGADVRRSLSKNIQLQNGESLYLSFLARERGQTQEAEEKSLKVSLEPDLPGRGRTRHRIVAFGISSQGRPFLSNRSQAQVAAIDITEANTFLCVLKLSRSGDGLTPWLRVFTDDEMPESEEPVAWTLRGSPSISDFNLRWLRLEAGENAEWEIDEMRLGTTWQAVSRTIEDSATSAEQTTTIQ